MKDEIISSISSYTERLRTLVGGLSTDELLEVYDHPDSEWVSKGKWTIAQVVHHIADAHMNKFFQLKDLLTSDNPMLVEYAGEKKFPNLPDANTSDIEPSLQILCGVHERTISLLKNLGNEDWDKEGIHPKGQTTVEAIAKTFVTHGEIHLEQLKEALSK